MKIECLTFFIYGMCVMFYSMMVWMFWRKGNDKLSRLIMLLMVVLDLECLKDLALYLSDFELHKSMWHWVNATDMVVVPVYTFVLMELVKPGWLSWRRQRFMRLLFFCLWSYMELLTNCFGLMC